MAKIRKMQENLRMYEYQQDGRLWLRERFKENPRDVIWEDFNPTLYTDHKWDGTRNPLWEGWQALSKVQNVGLVSATGTGKTRWLSRIVMWFLDVYPNPLVKTLAPKADQLKQNLWSEISSGYSKFKLIRPNSKLTGLTLYKDIMHPKNFRSARAEGQAVGVAADEKSATRFQGAHREYMLIIFEEMPGIHKAIIVAAENTSIGGHNILLGAGNPDHQLDELCKFAKKKSTTKIILSGYDHPNIVTGREVIPGAVSKKSIEMRKLEYGEESPFYKSRVRGIAPTESADSLFKLDWLNKSSDPDFTPTELQKWSYNAVGVDVANSFNGDAGAVAFGHEHTCDFLKEFVCPDASHLAYNLVMDQIELAKEFGNNVFHNYHIPNIRQYNITDNCIGVDAVGVGTGTINTLKWPLNVHAISLQGRQVDEAIQLDEEDKPMWNFNNLRSQMFWELREDLRLGRVKFKVGLDGIEKAIFTQLCEELLAHIYTSKSNKIVILSKDDTKKLLGGKSPNLADAVVYWNWMRKGYYAMDSYAGIVSK